MACSLNYSGSVGWQHFRGLHIRLGRSCSAFVTARAALPKNGMETLIGCQAEFEINLNKDVVFIR